MSLGKNKSSQAPSTVWDVQTPYLQSLYGQAMDVPTGTAQQYSGNIQQAVNPAFQTAVQGGIQDPRLTQTLRGLSTGATQNTALQGEIQAGLGDISRNFRQNILPGINLGSAMTNTAGGSRQGIAQGLAASEANRTAADFVNRMRSQNFGTQLQTQLGASGQLGQLLGLQNQQVMGALGQATPLSNLGFASAYAPLTYLGNILGRPTVLGGGGSSSGYGISIGGGE